MQTPCLLTNCIEGLSENEKDYIVSVVGNLYKECARRSSDLVNQRTIKYRVIELVGTTLNVSFEQLADLFYNNTRIHPSVAAELCRLLSNDDVVESLLAQDFVPTEKLVRLLKRLAPHANVLDALAAVDGLASTTPNKKYDCKRYLENLRFPLVFVENSDLKATHVASVRSLYHELRKWYPEERLAPYVYEVLREAFKDVTGVDLPTDGKEVLVDVMAKCKGSYLSDMGEENVHQFVKELKMKKPVESESECDGTKPSKKRKLEITEMKVDVDEK